MVKSSKKKMHRSPKYTKITQEQREQIISMKQQGVSCRQIGEQLNLNIKTIQSIKQVEKKSEYGELKKALIDYGIEKIQKVPNLDTTNRKRVQKIAAKIIKAQLSHQGSEFCNLIPEQKKMSNKRRIIQQIVEQIAHNVLNNERKVSQSKSQETCKVEEEEIIPKQEDCQQYSINHTWFQYYYPIQYFSFPLPQQQNEGK